MGYLFRSQPARGRAQSNAAAFQALAVQALPFHAFAFQSTDGVLGGRGRIRTNMGRVAPRRPNLAGCRPWLAAPGVPSYSMAAPMSSAPALAPGTARSVCMRAHFTWSGRQVGCRSRRRAAAPATCGAENEVPLIVA